jgi:hypothetical protein
MRRKQRVSWDLHPVLIEAVRLRAVEEGRSITSVVEQALAEHLHIPLANRDLPEQRVELCPACEKGVIWDGRCAVCNWHREHQPWRERAPA